jgi:hypothetical protein
MCLAIIILVVGCSTGGSKSIPVSEVSDGADIKWLRVQLKSGDEHILENPRIEADSLIGYEWPANDPKGIERQFKRYDMQGYPRRVAINLEEIVELTHPSSGANPGKVVAIGLAVIVSLLIIGIFVAGTSGVSDI